MDMNTNKRRNYKWVLSVVGGWAAAVALTCPSAVQAAKPLGPWSGERMALASARVAWQIELPMRHTVAIRSYHLVDGYLYGLGSDGFVRAIRADTGEYAWTRQLAEPFETIWPPVSARLVVMDEQKEPTEQSPSKAEGGTDQEAGEPKKPVKRTVAAVVFTLLRSAVFLDPKNGKLLKEFPLRSSSITPVAVSPECCFEVGPNRRLRCTNLKDGYLNWHMSPKAIIELAPVYVARDDVVVVADSKGTVAGITADLKKQFTQELKAKPIGSIAVDEKAVYMATADNMLTAIDRAGDSILWKYRLSGLPSDGPVATKKNVYQAVVNEGLFRVVKGEKRSWHNPKALCFLAEWPNRTAVLYPEGQVALLNPATGEAAELIEPGCATKGVSNTFNDAILLVSHKGRICCIRPIGAKELSLADFCQTKSAEAEKPAVIEENPGESDSVSPGAAAESANPQSNENVLLTDPLRSKRKIVQ